MLWCSLLISYCYSLIHFNTLSLFISLYLFLIITLLLFLFTNLVSSRFSFFFSERATKVSARTVFASPLTLILTRRSYLNATTAVEDT